MSARSCLRRARRICALLACCAFAAPAFAAEPAPLDTLYKAIARDIAQGDAWAIRHVLDRYEAKDATDFSVEVDPDAQPIWPKRPSSITPDEWAALKRSRLQFGFPESRSVGMALRDLDEDGRRDLVVDAYVGGTGLFSCVTVHRRVGQHFVSTGSNPDGECFYSINGRGSDQEAYWVKLGKRVYLAYREGEYGIDRLYLARAFAPQTMQTAGLAVDYRYRYEVLDQAPGSQDTPEEILAPDLRAALQTALDQMGDTPAQDAGGSYPTCPLPVGTAAADDPWPWFGAGHYTMEIVADLPVWLGQECHAARLILYRTSSLVDRTAIPIALSYMRAPTDEGRDIGVRIQRTALRVRRVRVDTGIPN